MKSDKQSGWESGVSGRGEPHRRRAGAMVATPPEPTDVGDESHKFGHLSGVAELGVHAQVALGHGKSTSSLRDGREEG